MLSILILTQYLRTIIIASQVLIKLATYWNYVVVYKFERLENTYY